MDISNWPQDLGLMKSNMEKLSSSTNNNTTINTISPRPQQLTDEIRSRKPQRDKTLNCPRCNSTNTKFCYYNNYSLTQPRYFCKTCRRYWTEGGSLRNVPIGGGSRKNKKSYTAPASTSISSPIMVSSCSTTTASTKVVDGTTTSDLKLAFSLVQPAEFTSSITTPFMPLMNYVPPTSYGMSNALSYPMDYVNINNINEVDRNENSAGRLLFRFEQARGMNCTGGDGNGDDEHHHHQQQQQNKLPEQSGGGDHHFYWNDLISGGGE